MITYHQFHRIHDLSENQNLGSAQIASELNLSRKTVKRWMEKDRYEPRRSPSRTSILDPFKDGITAMLEHHDYSAVQVFQELRRRGYQGGYSLVKDHVRRLRPPGREAFLTLRFDPGERAQVDFGECGKIRIGNTVRKFFVFVMTLCWSRLMYVEITMGQAAEHFFQGHRNAFEYFNAVPRVTMVDPPRRTRPRSSSIRLWGRRSQTRGTPTWPGTTGSRSRHADRAGEMRKDGSRTA